MKSNSLKPMLVHLVYCVSGIENFSTSTLCSIVNSVHLVYCVSGIENLTGLVDKGATGGSFSLLRERY